MSRDGKRRAVLVAVATAAPENINQLSHKGLTRFYRELNRAVSPTKGLVHWCECVYRGGTKGSPRRRWMTGGLATLSFTFDVRKLCKIKYKQ